MIDSLIRISNTILQLERGEGKARGDEVYTLYFFFRGLHLQIRKLVKTTTFPTKPPTTVSGGEVTPQSI